MVHEPTFWAILRCKCLGGAGPALGAEGLEADTSLSARSAALRYRCLPPTLAFAILSGAVPLRYVCTVKVGSHRIQCNHDNVPACLA
ncbi:hypothetical protein HaLaN_14091 [Haematococcus lacustris]|uniref:Uncharacterized protein n=1 Tax=Haematococcus lacustris TaxID=44745 RepID=A0A699ZNK8_HAELA|nr:hypothetical protein HaLaN_14091 [Haematococcus lacustris]